VGDIMVIQGDIMVIQEVYTTMLNKQMNLFVDDKQVIVNGWFPRIVKLRAEHYDYVNDPEAFLTVLRGSKIKSDIFTFLQETPDRNPKWNYRLECEDIAVLSITSYENWWKKQVNDKTRNMVRKAGKKGVDIKVVEFSDHFVNGIMTIYNESTLRQGKPFAHYGKDFETLKKDHISYLDQSDFIGAFYQGELIGFLKLVHGRGISNVMQIISMTAHKDKAPTNALLAKAVEICAERGVPYLHYGLWSRRGLGDFKKHHGFELVSVPRFYVPLNFIGRLCLKMGLHQKISRYLPGSWVDFLADIRTKWNIRKYNNNKAY
jgi:hypothetical protein